MCVELDLTKPLIPSFNVEGQKFSVVYESLNSLCTNYKWFGHSKEVCDGFHKTKAKEGMDVEIQGELRKDESTEGEMKEVRKTMQHVRRPPRYKANIQEPKFGSRFSVLREEVGMEGNGVEVEVNSEIPGPTVVLEHLPRVKVPSQQGKQGKMSGWGQGSRGAVNLRKEQGSRVTQVAKKGAVWRKEKVLTERSNEGLSNRMQEDNQNIESVSVVPESNMEMDKCKEVSMTEKENLHPGGKIGRVEVGVGDVEMLRVGADLSKNMGMSVGEEFNTSVLTNY